MRLKDINVGSAPCAVKNTTNISSHSLAVVFSDPANAALLRENGADVLIFEPLALAGDKLSAQLAQLPQGCLVQLPPQMTQTALDDVLACIYAHKEKISGVVAGCIGQVEQIRDLPVWAGPGIPVSNCRALKAVTELGVEGYHLWPEWSRDEQKQLMPLPGQAFLKVYGREILMLLNHCPERVGRGLRTGRSKCALCKGSSMACGLENPALVDQKGYRFPLQRVVHPDGCVLRVLGTLPTDLRIYEQDRKLLGAAMLLHFTTESAAEQAAITRAFAAIRDGQSPEKPVGTTAGHWHRGIE